MLLSGCNILHIEKTGIHPFLIQVPKIMNIAHAGGKGLGPENTFITLHNAVKPGADILEIDIHLRVFNFDSLFFFFKQKAADELGL